MVLSFMYGVRGEVGRDLDQSRTLALSTLPPNPDHRIMTGAGLFGDGG